MSNSHVKVPSNFPQGMSNEELQETVNGYLLEVRKSGSQENVVIQRYPLIALGLNELQTRQNNRVTCISVGIGAVSLAVAAVALWISIVGARSSDESSARQIALLEELNKNVLESQKIVTAILKPQATPPQKLANPAVKRDAPKAARFLPKR